MSEDNTEASALDKYIEEAQQLLKEIGPPPPRIIKLNSRMVERLRSSIPTIEPFLSIPYFGVEIEIDDTLPDHVMKVGEDLHRTYAGQGRYELDPRFHTPGWAEKRLQELQEKQKS